MGVCVCVYVCVVLVVFVVCVVIVVVVVVVVFVTFVVFVVFALFFSVTIVVVCVIVLVYILILICSLVSPSHPISFGFCYAFSNPFWKLLFFSLLLLVYHKYLIIFVLGSLFFHYPYSPNPLVLVLLFLPHPFFWLVGI